jgi:hypothetical protein
MTRFTLRLKLGQLKGLDCKTGWLDKPWPVRIRIYDSVEQMHRLLALDEDDYVGYCEDQIRVSFRRKKVMNPRSSPRGKILEYSVEIREVVVHLASGWIGTNTVTHELAHAAISLCDKIVERDRITRFDHNELLCTVIGYLCADFWTEFYERFYVKDRTACNPSGKAAERKLK